MKAQIIHVVEPCEADTEGTNYPEAEAVSEAILSINIDTSNLDLGKVNSLRYIATCAIAADVAICEVLDKLDIPVRSYQVTKREVPFYLGCRLMHILSNTCNKFGGAVVSHINNGEMHRSEHWNDNDFYMYTDPYGNVLFYAHHVHGDAPMTFFTLIN